MKTLLALIACMALLPSSAGARQADEACEPSQHRFPQELVQIPDGYAAPAEQQGTLENLYYETWESLSYDQQTQRLTKRAVVYLPYGYTPEREYPVFYLMHGGWSDETGYLGTPEQPRAMKSILDHGIADGEIEPMIVVCPTYNNLSGEDSGDYALALRLTENYHNELRNDLIPAVDAAYSTIPDRDHRAFAGFSMGSVCTWRAFQHALDAFRYFMPSSGSLTGDGEAMAQMAQDAGYAWNDFFIFAASGTDDFACSSFKNQIEAMADAPSGMFRTADNEEEGNLCYLEQPGGTHSGEYAMLYFYNGLLWLWKQ